MLFLVLSCPLSLNPGCIHQHPRSPSLSVFRSLSLSSSSFCMPISQQEVLYLSADRSKTLQCLWWMATVNMRRSRHQSPAAWLKHTIQQRRMLMYAADTRTSRKAFPKPYSSGKQSTCIRTWKRKLNINAEGELPQEIGFGYYILLLWGFKVTSLKQEGNCSKTSNVELNISSKWDESSRLMAQETGVCPDYACYKYESWRWLQLMILMGFLAFILFIYLLSQINSVVFYIKQWIKCMLIIIWFLFHATLFFNKCHSVNCINISNWSLLELKSEHL